MRKRLVASLLLLAGCAGSAIAGTYTVGVEQLDYYPHYRTDAKGEFSGFARAVFDAFAKDAGHTLVYKPRPVTRLYAEYLKGDLDLKYPDAPFWAKDLKGDKPIAYSKPVTPYIDGLLALPEFKGGTPVKRIGIVAGFTAFPYLDAVKAGTYVLDERPTLDQLLKAAIIKRVDAVYINVDVGRYALTTIGEDGKLVFLDAMPADRGDYTLSSIKHPALIAEFDAWMAKNGDTIKALRAEYKLDP